MFIVHRQHKIEIIQQNIFPNSNTEEVSINNIPIVLGAGAEEVIEVDSVELCILSVWEWSVLNITSSGLN